MMRFPTVGLPILIIVGLARADEADRPWQVHRQALDWQGSPVEEVATFWLANGNWWDESGELVNNYGLL
jgi:hypothetical protein